MSPSNARAPRSTHRTDLRRRRDLYDMATGAVPFDADNLMGILTKHLYENPIPPHELPPPVDVPPALEAVIMKCLSKKTEIRYQNMAELLADLEAIEAGLTPQAVVDNVARNTHASSKNTPTDMALGGGRITMGVGQPEVPKNKAVVPIAIGLFGGCSHRYSDRYERWRQARTRGSRGEAGNTRSARARARARANTRSTAARGRGP